MITHWAFYFEGKRFFEGNRVLATNHNIMGPIVPGLKMLGMLGSEQVKLESSATADVLSPAFDKQVQFVDGLATKGDRQGGPGKYSVVVWNHCDDWTVAGTRQVNLKLENLPYRAGQALEVRHWRIDGEHSNSYSEWVKLGRPEGPDESQLARLRQSQELALLDEPHPVKLAKDGVLELSFELPVHGLSLVELGEASAS